MLMTPAEIGERFMCCCPLRETTTREERLRRQFSFERLRPDGCPVHETVEYRTERIEEERRRAGAMSAARLSEREQGPPYPPIAGE